MSHIIYLDNNNKLYKTNILQNITSSNINIIDKYNSKGKSNQLLIKHDLNLIWYESFKQGKLIDINNKNINININKTNNISTISNNDKILIYNINNKSYNKINYSNLFIYPNKSLYFATNINIQNNTIIGNKKNNTIIKGKDILLNTEYNINIVSNNTIKIKNNNILNFNQIKLSNVISGYNNNIQYNIIKSYNSSKTNIKPYLQLMDANGSYGLSQEELSIKNNKLLWIKPNRNIQKCNTLFDLVNTSNNDGNIKIVLNPFNIWIYGNQISSNQSIWSSLSHISSYDSLTVLEAKYSLNTSPSTFIDFKNTNQSIHLINNTNFITITIKMSDDLLPIVILPTLSNMGLLTSLMLKLDNINITNTEPNTYIWTAKLSNISNIIDYTNYLESYIYQIIIKDRNNYNESTNKIILGNLNFKLNTPPLNVSIINAQYSLNTSPSTLIDFKNTNRNVHLINTNDSITITLLINNDTIPQIELPIISTMGLLNTNMLSVNNINIINNNDGTYTWTAIIKNISTSVDGNNYLDLFNYQITVKDTNTSTQILLGLLSFSLNIPPIPAIKYVVITHYITLESDTTRPMHWMSFGTDLETSFQQSTGISGAPVRILGVPRTDYYGVVIFPLDPYWLPMPIANDRYEPAADSSAQYGYQTTMARRGTKIKYEIYYNGDWNQSYPGWNTTNINLTTPQYNATKKLTLECDYAPVGTLNIYRKNPSNPTGWNNTSNYDAMQTDSNNWVNKSFFDTSWFYCDNANIIPNSLLTITSTFHNITINKSIKVWFVNPGNRLEQNGAGAIGRQNWHTDQIEAFPTWHVYEDNHNPTYFYITQAQGGEPNRGSDFPYDSGNKSAIQHKPHRGIQLFRSSPSLLNLKIQLNNWKWGFRVLAFGGNIFWNNAHSSGAWTFRWGPIATYYGGPVYSITGNGVYKLAIELHMIEPILSGNDILLKPFYRTTGNSGGLHIYAGGYNDAWGMFG